MIRTSMFKTFFRKFALAFLLAFLTPFLVKAELGITIVTPTSAQPGESIEAKFLVYNFEDILSMQFTVQWPAADLQYASVGVFNLNGLSPANFGTVLTNDGKLTFSWSDPNTNGLDRPDCSAIFSVFFIVLGNQIPPITIVNSPVVIEIIEFPGNSIGLEQTGHCADAAQVSGNIFNDLNNDCQSTVGEPGLQNWKLKIEQAGNTFYRNTNANGDYSFFALPGDYDVTLILPQNNLWTACQTTQTINIPDNQPVTLDFAAQALFDCPQMQVDIAAPFLRRCFNSTYYVHYCNQGTLLAEDAYVEVTLDPSLLAISSSIPWTMVNGQTYTFPIGDVAVGQCGDFSFTVSVSCDAVLGQTHCTEAHIFPDDICQPVNPLWDGSILDVTGSCDGDSVRFTITNIGDDMATPVPFIVIEDDMVNFSGSPIQLDAGGSFEVAVPANGATWRVEVENGQSSPFNGPTAASLEGCGVNGSGSFSLGFVTQFPQGDPSPFTDVDCQPNVGSYDPNDKTGYPNGFCAAHYIESNQAIEYKIRFQNTGTDTAFTVVVRDTLPLSLDPATVQPGASSHAYDFELLGNGVVQFTFGNIMLPDSNVNEMASHGFVNFTASQMAGNTNGTVINNQAAIYFDFNSPVYTNTYTHTVADDFVQSAGTDGDLSVSGYVRTWYGAPVGDVEVTLVPTCPVYSNNVGYYEFLQLDTSDYTLIANKPNLNKQEGVTVLDVINASSYALGVINFDFPEQAIAADINLSGSFSTTDFISFPKLVLNEPIGNLAENWRFIIEPNHFDNLSQSITDNNIKAIKPGNIIDESMVDSSIINPHFYFKVNPVVGGQLEIELKANGLSQCRGFQFGLNWDANVMNFVRVDTAAMVVRANGAIPGEVQFFALSGGIVSYPDSTILLKFIFSENAPIGSSTLLSLNEDLLPFQVVVEDLKLAGATVDNAQIDLLLDVPPVVESISMKTAPNPVQAGEPVFVGINSNFAQHINAQLYDASGKLLQIWDKNVPSGNTGFSLKAPLAKGIYLLKITDEKGNVAAAKLVTF